MDHKVLYHGTDKRSAEDILLNGVDQSKSAGGYFGTGFYLAEDEALARSNYADFSDDKDGVVLACHISQDARILDLSNEDDWIIWRDSGLDRKIHRSDFWKLATTMGIDGVKDSSFGGIVLYNPRCIERLEMMPAAKRRISPSC